MTPQNRKALHDIIDHAVNTGTPLSINVHPRYLEDLNALTDLARVSGDGTTSGAPSGFWHDFQFVGPPFHSTVTVFSPQELQPRPVRSTNPVKP